METTFYHDTMNTGNSLKQMKSKMTLDFGQPKAKKLNGLLSSPDLNICTLASPELERIIIQQNGMVTTTPTPTQFLFPKAVTEEQEAYARGFVDALEELHKTQNSDDGDSNDGEDEDVDVPVSTNMTTLQNVQTIQPGTTAVSIAQSQQMTVPSPAAFSFASNTATVPTSIQHTNAPMPTVVSNQQEYNMDSISRTSSPAQIPQPMAAHQRVMQLKEEPQTVPGYNSPPVSPINMEVQETIKLDRKRARNRVAARKCRYRKLERISRLEERVQDLTGQKDDLATNASDLREQVARLKQQIMEHVNSGCKVMLNSNLL